METRWCLWDCFYTKHYFISKLCPWNFLFAPYYDYYENRSDTWSSVQWSNDWIGLDLPFWPTKNTSDLVFLNVLDSYSYKESGSFVLSTFWSWMAFFDPAECWWIPQCFPLSFLEGCPLLPGQRVTIYRSSLLSLWITGHSRHSSSSPYLYIYVVEQSIQGERAPVRPWWILMDMLQWMKRGFYELKYCSWDLYLVDLLKGGYHNFYSFIGPVGRSYIHWTFS